MWRRAYAALLPGLLSLLTAGHVCAASQQETLQAVEACMAQVFASRETVYQEARIRLAAECPELHARLDNTVLAQLQPQLEEETTFQQLHDAQRSLASFAPGTDTTRHALDHAALPTLLESVYEPYVKTELPPNPIDRFWAWVGDKLREFLSEDNWLTRNFEFNPDPDTDFLQGLKNTVIVVLIVLILYILISEMRAANVLGLLRRRRGRPLRANMNNGGLQPDRVHKLADISDLPLHQQVPALLRYAIHYLIEHQLLPRQYSLTNREFLTLLRHKLPDVAHEFEILVNNGERVMYGNKLLAAGDAARLFEHMQKIEHMPGKGHA